MSSRFSSSALALLLGLSATPGLAATFLQEENIEITEAVKDNVYAVGEHISTTKSINGDLFAAGGTIDIGGAVQEDTLLAGKTITITGTVTGDVRAAGESIVISGNVNGDVLAAGANITIEKTSTVRGDVVLMGGTLTLLGTVRGDVRVMGGEVVIAGAVLGTLDAKAGKLTISNTMSGISSLAAKDLILTNAASFAKDIHYWTPGDVDFGTKARGTVTKDSVLQPGLQGGKAVVAFLFGISLFVFLAGALVILLIVLITQKSLATAARKLSDAPGKAALTGFLFFFLTPLLIVLLMLSVIGAPLGLLALALYIFSFFFAPIFTSVVLAKWFQMYQKWNMGKFMFFLLCLITFIFLELLILIPVIGWIMKAALICMGFGAILQFKWEIARKTY